MAVQLSVMVALTMVVIKEHKAGEGERGSNGQIGVGKLLHCLFPLLSILLG